MGLTPSSSEGGGTGLPTQWTQAADDGVTATADAGAVTLTVKSGDTRVAGVRMLEVTNADGDDLFQGYSDGSARWSATKANADFRMTTDDAGRVFQADAAVTKLAHSVAAFAEFGLKTSGATEVLFFNPSNAAIADADLAIGAFSLWLDDTPAATKLMVKAKDSAGTVVTAAIALA